VTLSDKTKIEAGTALTIGTFGPTTTGRTRTSLA